LELLSKTYSGSITKFFAKVSLSLFFDTFTDIHLKKNQKYQEQNISVKQFPGIIHVSIFYSALSVKYVGIQKSLNAAGFK
jgi:hypothetical protein